MAITTRYVTNVSLLLRFSADKSTPVSIVQRCTKPKTRLHYRVAGLTSGVILWACVLCFPVVWLFSVTGNPFPSTNGEQVVDVTSPSFDYVSAFRAQFASITGGCDPFAWQEQLFATFLSRNIPTRIDLPTWAGKNSVVAILLLGLAAGPFAAWRPCCGDGLYSCSIVPLQTASEIKY